MSFYERYARICLERGLDPCSQKAADLIGTTRSTISVWNTKKTVPKGEFVAAIANALGVSTDYLLGRTDNPTDYSNTELIAAMSGTDLDEPNETVIEEQLPPILRLYKKLDEIDQAKAEAYMEGLLSADKYAEKKRA